MSLKLPCSIVSTACMTTGRMSEAVEAANIAKAPRRRRSIDLKCSVGVANARIHACESSSFRACEEMVSTSLHNIGLPSLRHTWSLIHDCFSCCVAVHFARLQPRPAQMRPNTPVKTVIAPTQILTYFTLALDVPEALDGAWKRGSKDDDCVDALIGVGLPLPPPPAGV